MTRQGGKKGYQKHKIPTMTTVIVAMETKEQIWDNTLEMRPLLTAHLFYRLDADMIQRLKEASGFLQNDPVRKNTSC